jgi:hypothetical protein
MIALNGLAIKHRDQDGCRLVAEFGGRLQSQRASPIERNPCSLQPAPGPTRWRQAILPLDELSRVQQRHPQQVLGHFHLCSAGKLHGVAEVLDHQVAVGRFLRHRVACWSVFHVNRLGV